MVIFKLKAVKSHSEYYFANYNDMRDSLFVSYSAYSQVDIRVTPEPFGGPTFTVTAVDRETGEHIKDVFTSERITVIDRTGHL